MFDGQNLVVQANKLIMSPQTFTLEEKKFILCLTSKISPDDKDFKTYRVRFDEYANFIGKEYDYVKNNLPDITRNILRQILEIEDDEVLKQRAVLIGANHVKGYGYVDVQFHPDMKEVLLDLKERFTQYKLEDALNMTKKHSLRLYEIVKANQFKEQKKFRLSWSFIPKPLKRDYPEPDIQKLLGTEYKSFYDFEKHIIKAAQKEIQQHTDVSFEYQKVKEGRYVCAIDFWIKENVPPVNHNQMTIFDMVNIENTKAKSVIEMALEAEKAIDSLDRGTLCREFQKAVKRVFGYDFPLTKLEDIPNKKIVEVMPTLSSLPIAHKESQRAVTSYITKVLKG